MADLPASSTVERAFARRSRDCHLDVRDHNRGVERQGTESSCYRLLMSFEARCPGYGWENVVWDAWRAILEVYFLPNVRPDGSL